MLIKRLRYVAFIFFGVIVLFFFYLQSRIRSYSFFIEFDNSNGIVQGTTVRMRGVNIGSVQNTKLKLDCVIALVKINSNKILIPVNSIIETTQTGLLNEPIIDIIPLKSLQIKEHTICFNPISKNCDNSYIICHYSYVRGNRGLNYDDLVRSTTRISQRFDDPRFFNLFYVFLQNGIELTDSLLEFFSILLDFVSLSHISFLHFLANHMFEQLS